jgi:DNA-binding MarR family transcriptional regulator
MVKRPEQSHHDRIRDPTQGLFANGFLWPFSGGFLQLATERPMHTKDPTRQLRSLRACHLPADRERLARVRERRAYIPELSEALERDPNLCDGARRCARLLAGYVYRRSRESRASQITVSYLSKAMGRSRRTVQRYLRQLERAGYIRTDVVASQRSRLCVGLEVTLLRRLFAAHHAQRWPAQLRKPAVTPMSLKHRQQIQKSADSGAALGTSMHGRGISSSDAKSAAPSSGITAEPRGASLPFNSPALGEHRRVCARANQ